jgi:glycosyltransferase involved in cell wall biosynthesis/GT2 family glycosyltransferase
MSRILVVAKEFTEGGAAYLALRHIRRLADSHAIDLLVTGPVSESLAESLPDGVTLARIAIEQDAAGGSLLELRETLRDLAHPCLEREYDAVLGSSLFPDMTACAAFALCRAQRKLLVLLDEGLLAPRWSDDARAAMQGAILAADHVLPVSRGLLETLARAWPSLRDIPVTVIPPPIDRPREHEPDPLSAYRGDGRLRVVTVARLSPEKQIPMCLRIHRRLRDAGHDFHWHVVGEGIERTRIETEIAALGMGDRFWLEGFQESPQAWMRHADLFILCSRSEGCPTVIREALAEGTPVLSTDVNGARELIDDGVTGVVVANDESVIADALGGLVADAPWRLHLREAIRRLLPATLAGGETAKLRECLACEPRPRPAPTVTILIPTYNHARFIGRAIQSGLMQDYANVEVVVCDDASSDESEAVIRRQHDPRMRYVRRDVNVGRGVNHRQSLRDDATGEWVVMLDGDDYFTDPCFISKAVRALERHAEARPLFVQAGHRVLREPAIAAANRLRPFVDILPQIPDESQVMAGGEYLAFVYDTGFFTHLGTLYNREAAVRQGFYATDISSADMDSLLRLALTGNVVVLKTIAGCWVQHGGNASGNLPLDRIEENVRLFRRIAEHGAAAGRLEMRQIERALTRYEARTLAHLFCTTIGRSSHGLLDALQMLWIMVRVNPRVGLEPELRRAWWRSSKNLARMSLKRLKNRLRQAFGREPRGAG